MKPTFEVFIRNDQPTSCPYCGSRTEILVDLSCTRFQTQIHECLRKTCRYVFIEENEFDFYNEGNNRTI